MTTAILQITIGPFSMGEKVQVFLLGRMGKFVMYNVVGISNPKKSDVICEDFLMIEHTPVSGQRLRISDHC